MKNFDFIIRSRYPVYLLCILFLSVFTINDVMLFAMVDNDCIERLDEAEELYRTGGFDEAIEILVYCLDEGELPDDDKMRAYRLLGLAYIAQDYLEDARRAIARLLDLVPDYTPDPIQDPPTFRRLVEDVRVDEEDDDALPQPPVAEERTSIWYYIGGGILAAGAAVGAVLMLSGDGDDDDPELPGPPALP